MADVGYLRHMTTATNLTQTLGDRLRKSRKSAGFSQAQMATFLHVNRGTVVAWEADSNDIPARKLAEWAQIVDLQPNDLLLTAGKPEVPMRGRSGGRPRTPVVLDFVPDATCISLH